ncbi:MAG TPA: energy-coupling factor transporter transmembrane component T [Symbiobacteriaceae bacterium]
MNRLRLSLYVPGNTWVHRLDPVTKLIMAVVAVTLVFLLPGFGAAVALLAVSLGVLAAGGVLRRSVPVFAGVLVIALTFVVVQGLVYPGNQHPALTLGPITFYREGLLLGLRLTLRLFNILAATLVLILLTSPADLVESLVRRGVSPRFGYVLVSVLQIIPNMAAAAGTIMDAQRSRGMETEGSLWTRLRAFIPLMGPLVTSSLIATEERALALEVRGFSGNRKPTFLHEEVIPPYAWVIRALYLTALILAIAGRWMGWL